MRQKIGIKFIKPDGTDGIRSKMEDFETLHDRVYLRALKIIDDNKSTLEAYHKAAIAYNNFDFKAALEGFRLLSTICSGLMEDIAPYIEVCERMESMDLNDQEKAELSALEMYLNASKLKRKFMKKPRVLARCKYCGRLTPYVDPNHGFAYLNQNNCDNCGRGYPMADGIWDSVDGQAYIYYRNSVKDDVFYDEFEKKYEVLEDRSYFLKK